MTRRWEEPETWFHNKATDYVVAQIMFHLNKVGVFSLLAQSEDWVESIAIADRLSLDEGVVSLLLSYLSSVDPVLEENSVGAFRLSEFGRRVVQRYGKETEAGLHINMFDVRVGAYGPVWAALEGLVKGTASYGEDVLRAGTYAERGLYATAKGMGPSLMDAIDPVCATVVELGVETGLLEYVGRRRPGIELFALDRSAEALKNCCEMAEKEGISGIEEIHSDLFDVRGWSKALAGRPPGVIYTIHMHEFMAAGRSRMVALVDLMVKFLPGWELVFFEQPRPDSAGEGEMEESIWLAAQSNILIHHLIKNGKILYGRDWQSIIVESGASLRDVKPTGYLNYDRYTVRL